MPEFVVVIVAAVAVVIGVAIGFMARTFVANGAVKHAEQYGQRLVAEARAKQKEIVLEGKDEALQLRRAAEEEAREQRATLQRSEGRLIDREEAIDRRSAALEQRETELAGRNTELESERSRLDDLRRRQLVELERVSGLTGAEAREALIGQIVDEAQAEAQHRVREIERHAQEEGDDRARHILTTVMQRIAADHTSEATITVVTLPNEEMKGRIIGREGRNIRALEQATGVDLIIDDTPEAVVLSGFDPVRREVARMALMKLIGDGRIHPGRIEETVAKSRAEIEVVMRQAGEQAAYDAGVPGLHPELIKLLGRLKYRTSYGQNVLDHCIETSRLGGLLAAEIGANVGESKKGGLLHDIGKAVDHEVEGPHAAIGGDIASRYGVSRVVCNAIAAHHQEVEQESVEATVVQIADAISASRPGARGESLDNYVKRLDDLQQIALSFPGCRALLRHPGRPRDPNPGAAGGHRRSCLEPAGARRGAQDRGAAPVPRADQGHRHSRDPRRRLREVSGPGGALRICVIGDIIGKPGRLAVMHALPDLRAELGSDLVIANGENTAAGAGLTPSLAEELLGGGVDVITSGNHIWDKREIYDYLDTDRPVLRPINYPDTAPGRGWLVHHTDAGDEVAVINAMGRVFMNQLDSPFTVIDALLEEAAEPLPPVRIVDFHCEITSEKNAMGWYLDGRVSAVVGTHTHVPTADGRILPAGHRLSQ